MKIFYIFIILIIAGCAVSDTNEGELVEEAAEENFGTASEGIIQEQTSEEQEAKQDVNIEIIGLNKIKKRSIEVAISDIRKENINDVSNIFFTFSGEDLIKDEQKSKDARNFALRNPLEWNGYLFLDTDKIKKIFLCNSKSGEDKWVNTFCEEESSLKDLKSDVFFLIYTTEDVDQLGPMNLGAIESLGNTYIFKLKLQKV